MNLYNADSEMNIFTSDAYTGSSSLATQSNIIYSKVDNDTIFTVTFNLGKIVKGMFTFLTEYSEFTLQCFPEGIQVIETLSDSTGRKEHVTELIFDGKKQQDYSFIPENLPENFTVRNCVCLQFSVKNVSDLMANNKKETSVKFLYSKSNIAVLKVFLYESDEKPIYSEVPVKRYFQQPKNFINDEISSENLSPLLKLSSTDFVRFIERINKKNYSIHDFEISVYTSGGMAMKSLSPSGTSCEYGDRSGTEYKFIFPPKMTGVFKTLAKIAVEKTSLFFYALDNKMLRISQWISSIGYQKFYYLQSDKMLVVYQQQQMIQQQSMINNHQAFMSNNQQQFSTPQFYQTQNLYTQPQVTQEQMEEYYRKMEQYQRDMAEYNRKMLEYQQHQSNLVQK